MAVPPGHFQDVRRVMRRRWRRRALGAITAAAMADSMRAVLIRSPESDKLSPGPLSAWRRASWIWVGEAAAGDRARTGQPAGLAAVRPGHCESGDGCHDEPRPRCRCPGDTACGGTGRGSRARPTGRRSARPEPTRPGQSPPATCSSQRQKLGSHCPAPTSSPCRRRRRSCPRSPPRGRRRAGAGHPERAGTGPLIPAGGARRSGHEHADSTAQGHASSSARLAPPGPGPGGAGSPAASRCGPP